MSLLTSTATDEESELGGTTRRSVYLVRVMHYAQPGAGSERYDLTRVQEVVIGRADEPQRIRRLEGGRIELKIGVPDARMSSEHTRLSSDGVTWRLTDMDSRNGVRVNGAPTARCLLSDRDDIELGRTMFVFRQCGREAADLRQEELDRGPLLEHTLHAPLSAELETLRRIAPTNLAVLVRGETGTGKELAARAVHEASGRSGPFVAVNCGALSPSLLESELFGHVRGAFSGATEDKPGLIRAAHGGTLFLDEVAELPAESQVALLRALQESEVRPVGGTTSVRVDVRIVSATHQDLGARIADGRFREDLYARLSGREVTLPPLRDRPEDLGLLVATALRDSGADPSATLSRPAARALFRYPWPRNVRELRSAIEAAVSVSTTPRIDLESLPAAVREAVREAPAEVDAAPSGEPASFDRIRFADDPEAAVRAALAHHRGNVSAAAQALGKSRAHFYRLLEKFGVDATEYRE